MCVGWLYGHMFTNRFYDKSCGFILLVRFSSHSVATSSSDLHTAAETIHKKYANEGASTVIKPFLQISIT
jgi:hypothetical protein